MTRCFSRTRFTNKYCTVVSNVRLLRLGILTTLFWFLGQNQDELVLFTLRVCIGKGEHVNDVSWALKKMYLQAHLVYSVHKTHSTWFRPDKQDRVVNIIRFENSADPNKYQLSFRDLQKKRCQSKGNILWRDLNFIYFLIIQGTILCSLCFMFPYKFV